MESERLRRVPPYLFADLDRRREALEARGVDVISLAIGDPDLPTPDHVVEALVRAARDPSTHRYPPYEGTRDLRAAVAEWYRRRFGVVLDPDREVLILIGSKEGLAHLPWALLNPGEAALVPDPGYPVYRTATILADAEPIPLPLDPGRGFLPDLRALGDAPAARLVFLNYPNNPTAATAEPTFFQEAVRVAHAHRLIVAHDNSYSEVAYDGYRPPSILEADGARDIAVEFHSLSKTFCMTGWRLGFVVGNAGVVQALGKLKTNVDSGQWTAVQAAAVAALLGPDQPVRERVRHYQARRDRVWRTLQRLGWDAAKPRATLYAWARVPQGYDSVTFAAHVLDRTGVVITPGLGYGEQGRHYVRLSLTTPDERLDEALARLEDRLG